VKLGKEEKSKLRLYIISRQFGGNHNDKYSEMQNTNRENPKTNLCRFRLRAAEAEKNYWEYKISKIVVIDV
jgi:hypothetical protein